MDRQCVQLLGTSSYKELNSIRTARTHWTSIVPNDARFYIAHIQTVYTARTFVIFTDAYLYAAYFPDSSVEGVETLL